MKHSFLPDAIRLLIVFYSRSGSAAARAAAAAVRLGQAREVVDEAAMEKSEGRLENAKRQNALYEAPTIQDADWADAIVLGTPCYFSSMATWMKAYFDQLGPQWKQGALAGKVGGAFATASWPHGGTSGDSDRAAWPYRQGDAEAGSPYGASAIMGSENRSPCPEEPEAVWHQGRRIVAIAGALASAGEMPSRRS